MTPPRAAQRDPRVASGLILAGLLTAGWIDRAVTARLRADHEMDVARVPPNPGIGDAVPVRVLLLRAALAVCGCNLYALVLFCVLRFRASNGGSGTSATVVFFLEDPTRPRGARGHHMSVMHTALTVYGLAAVISIVACCAAVGSPFCTESLCAGLLVFAIEDVILASKASRLGVALHAVASVCSAVSIVFVSVAAHSNDLADSVTSPCSTFYGWLLTACVPLLAPVLLRAFNESLHPDPLTLELLLMALPVSCGILLVWTLGVVGPAQEAAEPAGHDFPSWWNVLPCAADDPYARIFTSVVMPVPVTSVLMGTLAVPARFNTNHILVPFAVALYVRHTLVRPDNQMVATAAVVGCVGFAVHAYASSFRPLAPKEDASAALEEAAGLTEEMTVAA